MEIESLFSSTRWEILKQLSEKKLSPIELSEIINTTSANISQQLRLLELGGLVKSERLSNTAKGKPRIHYSLADDFSYLILTAKDFADKKLLNLGVYHEFVIKSWFLKKEEYHEFLGKFFWEIEPLLDDLSFIAVDTSKRSLDIIMITEDKKKFSRVSADQKKVRLSIVSKKEFEEMTIKKSDLLKLYDPDDYMKGDRGE
ncbi:ArsR family transcriptional regulator [Candidatus Woesearchaeota archaeon]|nr:ArsR family transcriptional regulator [Candidatus Woesearchaeota archaeon]